MLGLSLGKLLLLAILIAIVWYGFKYAARVEAIKQRARAEALRRQQAGDTRGGEMRGGGNGPSRSVEDLVKCPRCGSFVAAQGAGNCGKPGCPWGA